LYFALHLIPKCNQVYAVKVSLPSSNQGRIQGGEIGAIAPLKPTKVTLFTMILYNIEKCIRNGQFCRPFFCHSSVV